MYIILLYAVFYGADTKGLVESKLVFSSSVQHCTRNAMRFFSLFRVPFTDTIYGASNPLSFQKR